MSPRRPKDRSAQNGLRDPTALEPTLHRVQALLIITPQPIIPAETGMVHEGWLGAEAH
jgi:hypothetical protein